MHSDDGQELERLFYIAASSGHASRDRLTDFRVAPVYDLFSFPESLDSDMPWNLVRNGGFRLQEFIFSQSWLIASFYDPNNEFSL